MDKAEFEAWFREHLSEMAELGIMHFNSPWAKTVRLSLTVNKPAIDALAERMAALEMEIAILKAKPKPTRKKKTDV